MKSLKLILSNLRYFAPSWVFSSVNIMIGTWVLYLPFIKKKFILDDSQIGVALFFTALGLLISIPFVPVINKKIGIGKSTKYGIIIFALLFNLPLIAPSYELLCAGLLLTGVFSGFTDVSMNALVSNIEKMDDENFMSAAHGFFSLGGFLGAGIGSILMLLFSKPSYHMLLMSFFIITTNLLLSKNYENLDEPISEAESNKSSSFKEIKLVLVLSVIAFIIMFNEGAVEHWSNLYLHDIVKVSENQAGLGFIIFSLTMTIGRFLGDGISRKIGSVKIIAYGSIIAILAYSLIVTANLYVTVLGFGVLGFGLSVIIPEILRLAGKTKGIHTSVAISLVSGIGFVGFLLGPIILGFISDWSSLVTSYFFLMVLVILAFVLTILDVRKRYNN